MENASSSSSSRQAQPPKRKRVERGRSKNGESGPPEKPEAVPIDLV